jgi:hypothetical protein
MNNQVENKWTEQICELLQKEIDTDKYVVTCFEPLPYSVSIKKYNSEKEPQISLMSYETDLLIKEKINDAYIPRLVIESKYRDITTHDTITYNNKAENHKSIHNGLRYGLLIGNNGNASISPRIVKHGTSFDFMIAFSGENPQEKEWDVFIDIVKRNLDYSRNIQNIFENKGHKDKNRYFCIEKELKFYS